MALGAFYGSDKPTIQRWDDLVTNHMEITLDESALPEPLRCLLNELRGAKPVRFFDQRKCPYELQRRNRAWNVSQPDHFAVWLDPSSTSMVASLGHEIGHCYLVCKELTVQFAVSDPYGSFCIPSMIEDPMVERLLASMGVDRLQFRQDTCDDFRHAFTTTDFPQSIPYHIESQMQLCHRYVVARFILGTDRFQPLGRLWARRVQCGETRRRTRQVYEYLERHLPEDQEEYAAAHTFICSVFGVRWQRV